MIFEKVFGRNKRVLGVKVPDKKTGEIKVLLNPSGKGAKYSKELKDGVSYTNSGRVKKTRSGKVKRLKDTQKSYRAGYLDAQKDNAKAYNSRRRRGGDSYKKD